MALDFMDNFSQYGTDENNMLANIYTQASADLVADPDGVSSGKVMQFLAGTDALRKTLIGAEATVGVAQRFWFTALPNSSATRTKILQFNDINNFINVGLLVETTGQISVWRGGNGFGNIYTTQLGITSIPVIAAGAWYHVEAEVYIRASAGTVEIRVNRQPVLVLTGQDTIGYNGSIIEGGAGSAPNAASVSQIKWDALGFAEAGGTGFYLKDIYIWNGNGSLNNDFVGDVSIVSLIPNGDDPLNWTPSTGGTGFNLIDEVTPDDADYILADSTPPAASTFTLTDLAADVTAVKGVLMFTRMLKSDSGAATVQTSAVSSGVDGDGANRAMTTTAAYYTDVMDADPNTGTAWTRITVNAMKIKVDRTA